MKIVENMDTVGCKIKLTTVIFYNYALITIVFFHNFTFLSFLL